MTARGARSFGRNETFSIDSEESSESGDLYEEFLRRSFPSDENGGSSFVGSRATEPTKSEIGRSVLLSVGTPPELPRRREEDDFCKPSETAFGNTKNDVEWNRFAISFYSWLRSVGRLNAYWHDVVLRDPSGWEESTRLLDPSCLEVHEKATPKTSPHLPDSECLKLDPCNTRNGKHLCYAYWLKILRSATELYSVLTDFFLKATGMLNFSKVVLLEGVKEEASDGLGASYVPSHKTSMKASLWVEACRTRLVCRMPQIFPLSQRSYDLQKSFDRGLLEKAARLGLLNTCFSQRPVLVTPYQLHSTLRLTDLLARKDRIYSDRRSCCDSALAAAAAGLAERCDAEIEFKAKQCLISTMDRWPVPPVTCYEEAAGSLMHRHRTLWRNAFVTDYENYLLDKQSVYFFSPKGSDVYDDSALRCPLSMKAAIRSSCANRESPLPDEVAKPVAELQKSVQYFPNGHFAFHSACFGADVAREIRRVCARPHSPWIPSTKNEEEAAFKNEYFTNLRTFFKVWFYYKQIHAPEMLQDDLNERYVGAFLTPCEVEWGKYRGKHVDWFAVAGIGASATVMQKVVSETKTSLLRALRNYERERINADRGTSVVETHLKHRAAFLYRGYADWTRMFIVGSVFGLHFKEFASSGSPFVLDQDQDEGNPEWFEKEDFPFLWYVGGRYRVFCNGRTWYRWRCPLDLAELVRAKTVHAGSAGADVRAKLVDPKRHDDVDDGWFGGFVEKCREELIANPTLDPHFYPGVEPRTLKIFLRNHLRGAEKWKFGMARCTSEGEEKEEEEEEVGGGPLEGNEYDAYDDNDDDDDCKEEEPLEILDENLCDWLNAEASLLRDARVRCGFEMLSTDDGDTFYDSIALWYMMCLEAIPPESEHSAKLRSSISEACNMVLDPTDEKVRNDRFFENFLTVAEKTKEMTQVYERSYLF